MKKLNSFMVSAIILLFNITAIQETKAQARVVIPGTFQSALGCPGDWMPDCDASELTYNPLNGSWMGTFFIPAGCHNYKVAIDGSWNENYGQNGIRDGQNIILGLGEATMVTFVYNHFTHLVYTYPVASGPSSFCAPQQAHIAGSFQSALGCPGDWMANCNLTEMEYNNDTKRFEKALLIPQGCWEFKITTNGSWNINYGLWGTLGGPNIIVSLPEGEGYVFFTYDPVTNWITASRQTMACEPNTVVLVGSFQKELGCPADWMADCDDTRMTYDVQDTSWKITVFLPAGKWDYKFAINNTWDENYGVGGAYDGESYQLDLCYPSEVTFRYGHSSHWSFYKVHTNGICLTKFYDPNTNSQQDIGESAMEGIKFELEGMGISQTKTTDSDGKLFFAEIPNGAYVITEDVPPGYYTSDQNPRYVYINNGMITVPIGNVCLGGGGAHGLGYWIGKQGENALLTTGKMQQALSRLRMLNLRNGSGEHFDPYTYESLRNWLKGANGKNMMYMLSAQMAAAVLNEFISNPDGDERFIYTGECANLYSKFMTMESIISYTNMYLAWVSQAKGNDPIRNEMECMKTLLEQANNNLNWVQSQPCENRNILVKKHEEVNQNTEEGSPMIWPNPSRDGFTLRPDNTTLNSSVQIRVIDMNGRTIYTVNGNNMKDYRFGENFHAGIYIVEINQAGQRRTLKIIKQ
jgi:hypothetical protein